MALYKISSDLLFFPQQYILFNRLVLYSPIPRPLLSRFPQSLLATLCVEFFK